MDQDHGGRRGIMDGTGRVFEAALAEAFTAPVASGAERDVRVGPLTVRVGFSSARLARSYLPSFVADETHRPELAVRIMTASDLDLAALVPVPPDQGRAFTLGRLFAVWHPDRRSVLYLLDCDAGRGLVWLPQDEAPQWELSRPFCPLVHAFLSETPWAAVHAASIGLDGRSLLLAGKGRSGKSTAALACAVAGWDYAGDDYVMADTEAGRICPLYASARLRTDMGGAFVGLRDDTTAVSDDDGDPRYELRLTSRLRGHIVGGQVAAMLLPRRTGADRPVFKSARRADGLNALFKVSMLSAPGPLDRTARKLARLVSHAPVFHVDTGTEPAAIPDAFARFLARL